MEDLDLDMDLDTSDDDMFDDEDLFGDMGDPFAPPPKLEGREAVIFKLKDAGNGFLESFKVNPTDIHNLTETVDNFMPDSISADVAPLKDLVNTFTDTLDTTKEELKKEATKAFQIADKLLPEDSKIRNITNKVKNFFGLNEDEYSNKVETEEERRDREISSSIVEALGELQNREDYQNYLRDTINDFSNRKERELLVRQSVYLSEINKFNQDVANRYYRESLKLQYQQVFFSSKLLELQKTGFDTFKNLLTGIAKNTALPDIIKQTNSEVLEHKLKQNLFDNISSTLFSKNDWVKNLKDSITDKATALVSGVASGVSMADSMSGMADMLGGEDLAAMGMTKENQIGGELGSAVRNFTAKKLGNLFEKTSLGKKTLGGIKSLMINPSEGLEDLAGENNDSVRYKLFTALSELTRVTDSENTISTIKKEDLTTPRVLDTKMYKTVTQVIPEILTKIFGEVNAIRTKSDTPKQIQYDFSSNKFIEKKEAEKEVSKDIRNEVIRSGVIDRVDRIIDTLSKETEIEIKPEEKVDLGKGILAYLLTNKSINPSRFEQNDFYSFFDNKVKDKAKKIFNTYLTTGDELEQAKHKEELFKALQYSKESIPNVVSQLDSALQNNKQEQLEKLGYIEYDKEAKQFKVNNDKFKETIIESYAATNNKELMSSLRKLTPEEEKEQKLKEKIAKQTASKINDIKEKVNTKFKDIKDNAKEKIEDIKEKIPDDVTNKISEIKSNISNIKKENIEEAVTKIKDKSIKLYQDTKSLTKEDIVNKFNTYKKELESKIDKITSKDLITELNKKKDLLLNKYNIKDSKVLKEVDKKIESISKSKEIEELKKKYYKQIDKIKNTETYESFKKKEKELETKLSKEINKIIDSKIYKDLENIIITKSKTLSNIDIQKVKNLKFKNIDISKVKKDFISKKDTIVSKVKDSDVYKETKKRYENSKDYIEEKVSTINKPELDFNSLPLELKDKLDSYKTLAIKQFNKEFNIKNLDIKDLKTKFNIQNIKENIKKELQGSKYKPTKEKITNLKQTLDNKVSDSKQVINKTVKNITDKSKQFTSSLNKQQVIKNTLSSSNINTGKQVIPITNIKTTKENIKTDTKTNIITKLKGFGKILAGIGSTKSKDDTQETQQMIEKVDKKLPNDKKNPMLTTIASLLNKISGNIVSGFSSNEETMKEVLDPEKGDSLLGKMFKGVFNYFKDTLTTTGKMTWGIGKTLGKFGGRLAMSASNKLLGTNFEHDGAFKGLAEDTVSGFKNYGGQLVNNIKRDAKWLGGVTKKIGINSIKAPITLPTKAISSVSSGVTNMFTPKEKEETIASKTKDLAKDSAKKIIKTTGKNLKRDLKYVGNKLNPFSKKENTEINKIENREVDIKKDKKELTNIKKEIIDKIETISLKQMYATDKIKDSKLGKAGSKLIEGVKDKTETSFLKAMYQYDKFKNSKIGKTVEDKKVKIEEKLLTVLEKIKKSQEPKKKNYFDADGDGDRDGNWKDRLKAVNSKAKEVGSKLKGIVKGATDKAKKDGWLFTLLTGAVALFSKMFKGIMSIGKGITSVVSNLSTIAKGIFSLPSKIAGGLKSIWDSTKNIASKGLEFVKNHTGDILTKGKDLAVAGFNKIKDFGSNILNKTKSLFTKIKPEVVTKATKVAPKTVKTGAVKSFLGKLKNTLVKKLGSKGASKLMGKIASRFVPIAGAAMLAYDAAKVGWYMLHDGMDFKSAVSKQILGFNIFNDDETPVDENGEPIKPDIPEDKIEQEKDKLLKEDKKDNKPETKQDKITKPIKERTDLTKDKAKELVVKNKPLNKPETNKPKTEKWSIKKLALTALKEANGDIMQYAVKRRYLELIHNKGLTPEEANKDMANWGRGGLDAINKYIAENNLNKEMSIAEIYNKRQSEIKAKKTEVVKNSTIIRQKDNTVVNNTKSTEVIKRDPVNEKQLKHAVKAAQATEAVANNTQRMVSTQEKTLSVLQKIEQHLKVQKVNTKPNEGNNINTVETKNDNRNETSINSKNKTHNRVVSPSIQPAISMARANY